jgi:hypothetical protein
MLTALRRARHRAILVVSFVVLAASGSWPARAQSAAQGQDPATAPRPYAIHIAHEATAGTLRRVLDGARERLGDPRCQLVLDDFRDGDGQTLRARLEETGLTPEDYLGLIVFYDGRKHPRCGQKGVLAVTHVGSRVVWVCPEKLLTRARRNPVWAEATLIHEALHTLGLGENPPSSREITSQVMRRCQH